MLDTSALTLTLAVLTIFLGGWILGAWMTWRVARWVARG